MSFKTNTLALSLTMLSLTGTTVYADYPDSDMDMPYAMPVSVSVPSQDGSWRLALDALYWQPVSNDLQYAIAKNHTTDANGATTDSLKTRDVSNDDGLGFRLDATYNIPVQGKDMELLVTYLGDNEFNDSNVTTRTDLGDANAVHLPWDVIFPALFDPSHLNTAQSFGLIKGEQDYQYIQGDFHVGQKMKVGNKVMLRPFIGMRLVDMEANNKVTGFSLDEQSIIQRWKFQSDFIGIGPRVGMDGRLKLGAGFSIVTRAGFSLLVGQQDRKHSVTQTGIVSDVSGSLNHDESTTARVVPESDLKVGLNWGYGFSNLWSAALELGFEVNNYYNVYNKSVLDSFDSVQHSSLFGWSGGYLQLMVGIG
ncbi:MAG: Lpg1974 family pore-forming outer membrane protein [Gammaproteobacteria bacterium]